jgi:hypothetical protein
MGSSRRNRLALLLVGGILLVPEAATARALLGFDMPWAFGDRRILATYSTEIDRQANEFTAGLEMWVYGRVSHHISVGASLRGLRWATQGGDNYQCGSEGGCLPSDVHWEGGYFELSPGIRFGFEETNPSLYGRLEPGFSLGVPSESNVSQLNWFQVFPGVVLAGFLGTEIKVPGEGIHFTFEVGYTWRGHLVDVRSDEARTLNGGQITGVLGMAFPLKGW